MADSAKKLRLLVCGNFSRETQAVLDSGDFPDVFVETYHTECGRPGQAERLAESLSEACSGGGDTMLLAGSCFPSERVDTIVLPPDCRLVRSEQCLYLLADKCFVDAIMGEGAYLMTPGWLSGWRTHIARWGFDRESARAFFAESASSLVLLDTGTDGRSALELEEFAAWVDRPRKTIAIGLDHFRMTLEGLVREWRLEAKDLDLRSRTDSINRKKADQAMLFDLMASLTHMGSEGEAIDQILGLFDMLFAPRRMVYASVSDGRVTACRAKPLPPPEIAECQAWLDSDKKDAPATDGKRSLSFAIAYRNEPLALLRMEEIAFPENRGEYIHLAEPLAQVCGLAISNARMLEDLKRLAITDPLTALFNRRHFFELGTIEFARSARYGHALAAIMLDVDFFKKVNDVHGHRAGDRVLVEVARLIRSELRASDICGRYGGEEFIALLPETGADIAMQAAERIRKSMEGLSIPCDGDVVNVTASLGVAVSDPDCPDLETLMARSDQALYAAKEGGRNRVRAWAGS